MQPRGPRLSRTLAAVASGVVLAGAVAAGPSAELSSPETRVPEVQAPDSPAVDPGALPHGRTVAVPADAAALLADHLGVTLPAGTDAEVDPALLLPGGRLGPPTTTIAHRADGTGRTAVLTTPQGPRDVLADYTGDGRPELQATTSRGVAVLDGATGVPLARVDEVVLGHLGRIGGTGHLAGITSPVADGIQLECTDDESAGVLDCEETRVSFSWQVVVRRAPSGAEVWRTPVGITATDRRTSVPGVAGLPGGSDSRRWVEAAWEPLLAEDGRLTGHVTARLDGTTTVRDDVTGLAGTASGEGLAAVSLHAPDGSVLATREVETTGPSHLRAVGDLTGDGQPDVVLVVASWDLGPYACAPVSTASGTPTPGGCALPYTASHLDVHLLDGRDLATVRTWRDDRPVADGGVWQAASVGDVDGDGLGDLVVAWPSFQDERWSPSRDQVLAVALGSGGGVTPVGRGGDGEFVQQVVRGPGRARVLLGSLQASFGGAVGGHGGLVETTLLSTGQADTPDDVEVRWRHAVVDLPAGTTSAGGDEVLAHAWPEQGPRGDVAVVLGFASTDLDGEPLADAVVGIGAATDGAWSSRTRWLGTGTGTVVLDEQVPVERWRLPLADLDLDGSAESVFATTGQLGPPDPAPLAIWRGRGGDVLWRRPAVRHGLAWTADLDGQRGPDVLLYPAPTAATEHHQVCLVRGRTGQLLWCFDGA